MVSVTKKNRLIINLKVTWPHKKNSLSYSNDMTLNLLTKKAKKINRKFFLKMSWTTLGCNKNLDELNNDGLSISYEKLLILFGILVGVEILQRLFSIFLSLVLGLSRPISCRSFPGPFGSATCHFQFFLNFRKILIIGPHKSNKSRGWKGVASNLHSLIGHNGFGIGEIERFIIMPFILKRNLHPFWIRD